MCDVFISHSSKDDLFVRQLEQELTAAGLKVWADHTTINPGDHIVLKIQEGLRKAKKVIPVLSPHYMESDWCQAEILDTLWNDPLNRNKRIIPVRIAHCTIPHLQRPLSYIDCVPNLTAGIQQTVDACKTLLPKEPSSPRKHYSSRLEQESPFHAGGNFPLDRAGYIWRNCDQQLVSEFYNHDKIMVLGNEMSGKSSLLDRKDAWARKLKESEKSWVTGLVSIDIARSARGASFSRRIHSRLLKEVNANGIAFHGDTFTDLVEEIIEKHRFVLILDEYQNLPCTEGCRAFLDEFFTLQQRHPTKIKLVVGSQSEPHVVADCVGLKSKRFRDFWHIVELKPFSEQDILVACRLFPEEIASVLEKLSNLILKKSNKPYDIQMRLDRIWQECKNTGFVQKKDLDLAIRRII